MSAVETVTDEVLALLQDAQANASARVAGFERHDLHMLWSALEQLRNQSLLTLHDSVLSVSDFTDRERQVLKALADLVVGVAGGAGLDLAGLHPGEIGLNFGVHDGLLVDRQDGGGNSWSDDDRKVSFPRLDLDDAASGAVPDVEEELFGPFFTSAESVSPTVIVQFCPHGFSPSSVVGASEGSGAAESADSAAPAGGGAP